MAELPTTMGETLKKLAGEYITNTVESIRIGMGGRASDAVKMTDEEELDAWMRETAPPEQVAQMIAEGASDDEILQAARKYRYALGKAAGRGDPVRETEYHERQAARASRYLEAIGGGMPPQEAMRLAMRSESKSSEGQAI